MSGSAARSSSCLKMIWLDGGKKTFVHHPDWNCMVPFCSKRLFHGGLRVKKMCLIWIYELPCKTYNMQFTIVISMGIWLFPCGIKWLKVIKSVLSIQTGHTSKTSFIFTAAYANLIFWQTVIYLFVRLCWPYNVTKVLLHICSWPCQSEIINKMRAKKDDMATPQLNFRFDTDNIWRCVLSFQLWSFLWIWRFSID